MNLSEQLKPTPIDKLRYGVPDEDKSIYDPLRELATALMITARAFKMGLTAQVLMPAMYDDPHPKLATNSTPVSTL